MPPPRILPWPRPAWPSPDPASGLSSNSSLVKPSSRPLAMARPEAAQGNRPFLTLMPCALAWVFGQAHPCHFGVGVGHAGITRALKAALASSLLPCSNDDTNRQTGLRGFVDILQLDGGPCVRGDGLNNWQPQARPCRVCTERSIQGFKALRVPIRGNSWPCIAHDQFDMVNCLAHFHPIAATTRCSIWVSASPNWKARSTLRFTPETLKLPSGFTTRFTGCRPKTTSSAVPTGPPAN